MEVASTFGPAFLGSLIMCLVIYLVDRQFPDASEIVSLYKIPLGALVYGVFNWFFFRARCEELVRVLFRLMGRT
jgi:hypothetical protein